ncbi:MAG: hypothetical protein K0R57_860 [Paenibacillaceae bacterium]|nr:hypothetical protein [Paenibacillaceae bacterium]
MLDCNFSALNFGGVKTVMLTPNLQYSSWWNQPLLYDPEIYFGPLEVELIARGKRHYSLTFLSNKAGAYGGSGGEQEFAIDLAWNGQVRTFIR